jgi:hypothetical protein
MAVSGGRAAKRQCRRLETTFRGTKESGDKQPKTGIQCGAPCCSKSLHVFTVGLYIKEQFDTVAGDSAATWKLTRAVLHRDHRPQRSDDECRSLADEFSVLFSNKLLQIQQTIASSLALLPDQIFTVKKYDCSVMSSFARATARRSAQNPGHILTKAVVSDRIIPLVCPCCCAYSGTFGQVVVCGVPLSRSIQDGSSDATSEKPELDIGRSAATTDSYPICRLYQR